MLEKYEYKVSNNDDVDKVKLNQDDNIRNIHLNLSGATSALDQNKFRELFEKIKNCKNFERVHIDLTKYPINNEEINTISSSLNTLEKLKELHLHLSDICFDDAQFKNMLKPLKKNISIETLHLVMENVNMNFYKRKKIEKLMNSLPNLKFVHINVKRNNLTQDDLGDLHKLLFHRPHRELIW
jgi:hypothetical protein